MRTALILFILLVINLNIQAQDEGANVQKYFLSELNALSIDAEVDEEGDIIFRIQDREFYLYVDPEDKNYLQLTRWGVWEVTNVTEAVDLLSLLNQINREQKVAKMFLMDDVVMVSAELFTDDQTIHRNLIKRSIEALITAENLFLSRLR